MLDRLLAWLKSDPERRFVQRRSGEGLKAFYWEGDVPRAHRVKDISKHGAYIETDSMSWRCGTLMMLTLQIGSDVAPGRDGLDSTTLPAEVVRASAQGMAIRFLFHTVEDRRRLGQFLSTWEHRLLSTDARSTPASTPGETICTPEPQPAEEPVPTEARVRAAGKQQGSSLIEFILLFPLLFLLVVNVVNFGSFMYGWITVANAARAGAQYFITGGATVFAPAGPTSGQVNTLITNDVFSVLNNTSPTVSICTNNNGTIGCVLGSSSNPPTDPEFPSYTVAWVDVSYTWVAPIPLWDFPALHVHATLPSPTTIRRRTVMRVLN